jgi:hypothetical protein
MTSEHFAVALWSYNHRRSFRPFFIELASGDRMLVTHPETEILRGELWEYVNPNGGHHVFESESVIHLLDAPKPPPP